MKHLKSLVSLFIFLFFLINIVKAQPTIEQFKQQYYLQMQQLKPEGFSRRNVSYVQVIKGSSRGGYYSFKVTAYIHDYAPGYPTNRYYGQTCVGKLDGEKYDMLKNEFGGWIIQGRFTASGSDRKCLDNTAEGTEAIPLASVQGSLYNPTQANQASKTAPQQKPSANKTLALYIGEYACYGTGNRMMAGMGFILRANVTYVDLDNKRGGTYTYNAQNATIHFNGGFLAGQVGKNVKQTGFQISNTVTAEPWR